MVAIIGIVAAIAIPSLLRARISSNEAAAIGDVRTVLSSEATYHSASGGYYGTMACLLVPTGPGCIPGYLPTAPNFVDSVIGSLQNKQGYSRSQDATAVVPLGLTCYVYHATPIQVGQTGVRGFAGDCSGVVCFNPSGAPVPAAGGRMGACMSIQ